MQTLTFRVIKIRDLRSDFTRGHPRGQLCVYATIFDEEKIIHSPPILHCYKGEELHWGLEEAIMKWSRSHDEFQNLKAAQPKIKFHLAVKASEGKVEDIGFFIVDIRNVFGDEHVGEVKVMNMHPSGAHIVIGCQFADSSRLADLMSSQELIQRASVDSVSSVLVVPPQYDPARGDTARFCISVRLQNFRDMEPVFRESAGSFWFCWSVLDMTIQSAVYGADGNYDLPSSDEHVYVECSEAALRNLLTEINVLRIFLCCQGKILRMADVPVSSSGAFPLLSDRWCALQPVDDLDGEAHCPSVRAAIEVALAPEGRPQSPPPPPAPLSSPKAAGRIVDEQSEGNEEEDYSDDEEFEKDVTPPSVHRHAEQTEPNPQTMHCISHENDLTPSLKFPALSARMASCLDDGESVYDNKHYRLCIQVKSVRDLTRAAHVTVQFAYPHLGISSSPVRTHGTWTAAHSECSVDGAAASFDFGMVPSHLQSILTENKLVVHVLSRSQMGQDVVGDATVDMDSLSSSRASFVYRCPVTGKQFRSLEQYNRHRRKMIALFSMGRVARVPPLMPVVIRSVDMFVSILLSEHSGRIVEVGKLRVVLTLEDMGAASPDTSDTFRSRRGGDALLHMRTYEGTGGEGQLPDGGRGTRGGASRVPPPPPSDSMPYDMTASEEEDIMRRVDWEEWRRGTEEKWMAALREKETKLRERLEEESTAKLSQRADDLKRAQEEVGRLEVRLRTSIDAVERQKAQLELKEEQMNIRLAQKTDELQLLQRKIREEAKAKIDMEARRAATLESQVSLLQENCSRMEKRALEAEKDYESYRTHVRSMPETSLREETARLKAQVAELRGDVERERRLRAEEEMEKEHYRSQMHRIAVALKREREKSSAVARQDLEQLRLEFLAREERYMLDGDRDELRAIRDELSYLRSAGPSPKRSPSADDISRSSSTHILAQKTTPFVVTRNATAHDSAINFDTSSDAATSAEKIARLRALKTELLESKLYDSSDSVIQELDSCIVKEQVIMAEMQPYTHGKLEIK